MNTPVLVFCLRRAEPVLGAESGWLLSSFVEDLLALAILLEPSLLVWSRAREMNMWSIMSQKTKHWHVGGGAYKHLRMGDYLVSARVALETQAGHWGFMCHGDLGGGARVPQVILVDLPLSWSYHQAGTVQGEVHRGQQTVHSDGSQDTSVTHAQHLGRQISWFPCIHKKVFKGLPTIYVETWLCVCVGGGRGYKKVNKGRKTLSSDSYKQWCKQWYKMSCHTDQTLAVGSP